MGSDCIRHLETLRRGAHTEVVHVDNGGWDPVQDKPKLGHEKGVGRMGGRPEITHVADDDSDERSDERLGPLEASASLSTQRTCTAYPFHPRALVPRGEDFRK